MFKEIAFACLVVFNVGEVFASNEHPALFKAEYYEKTGKLAAASSQYRRAVGVRTIHELAFYKYIKFLIATGNQSVALQEFEESSHQHGITSVYYLLSRAEINLSKGEIGKAKADVQAAAILDSRIVESKVLGARICKAEKNTSCTLELYKELSALDPNNIDYMLLIAEQFIDSNPSESERLYNKALALAPGKEEALSGLAVLFERKGKPEDAKKLAQQCVAMNPYSLPCLVLLGDQLISLNKFEMASEVFYKAYLLNENNYDVVRKVAKSLERSGRSDQARNLLEVKYESSNSEQYLQLLYDYEIATKDYGSAGRLLASYIENHKDSQWAVFTYANLLVRSGNLEVARNSLEDLVDESSSAENYEKLSEVRYMLGEFKKAMKDLEKALPEKVNQTDPRIAFNLGLLYEKNEKFDKAMEFYSLALSNAKIYPYAINNIAALNLKTAHQKEYEKNISDIRGFLEASTSRKIASTNECGSTVVKPGESLMDVSARIYGTTKNWKKIYEMNKAAIGKPNDLKVDTALKLTECKEIRKPAQRTNGFLSYLGGDEKVEPVTYQNIIVRE